MNEKYALFQYANSNNVGDEIQSIAARRFLPRIDYYIDRDSVGAWKNENQQEVVKLIANGWYMHDPYAWPISDATISPLLISLHVNETDGQVGQAFSSSRSVNYMNSLSPVGARDEATLNLLSSWGVEAYFSACLTLTLQRDKRIRRQEYILAVSISDETFRFIKQHTKRKVVRVNPYVDKGIDTIEKTKIAEYMLVLYQSAACIVTTKVHAMLPGLAFGTPVLRVDEDETYDPSRYSGLADLVHSVSRSDLVHGQYAYDFDSPPENPSTYEKYRDSLVSRCEEYTGYKKNKSFIRSITVDDIDEDSLTSAISTADYEMSASDVVGRIKPRTFSVIMPAYNVGECIEEAVLSIKNQSFTDFECIIVDDGSTDGGVDKIVKLVRDDRRFKIVRQKNGGLSNARNNGFDQAHGEYVLFLDSDDIFSHELLSAIYEKTSETKADVIVYNHSVLNNTTGYVSGGIHLLESLSKKEVLRPQDIQKTIFNTFGNQVWTKAFKRTFIDSLRLRFNEKLKRAEDIPYTYPALLSAKRIAVIDKPLVSYRVNRGTSNSDTLAKHYKDIFYALEALYDFMGQAGGYSKYKDSFDRLFLENIYYNLVSLVGTSKFVDELHLAQKYADRFNIDIKTNSSQSSDLLAISMLVKRGDVVDMLAHIALSESADRIKKQATIDGLLSHNSQLKSDLEDAESMINSQQKQIDEYTKVLEGKLVKNAHRASRAYHRIKGTKNNA